MSWESKTLQFCNKGFATDFNNYPGWDSLLQGYTGRKLTLETDRLIALQGLVTEMQKASGAGYHSGMWDPDLPSNLLWMIRRLETEIQALPLVPSWS